MGQYIFRRLYARLAGRAVRAHRHRQKGAAGRLLQVRAVFATGGTSMISQLAMAAAAIISARALGPTGKGIVVGITMWHQTLVWLAGAGIDQAMSIRLAETRPAERSEQLRIVIGNAVLSCIALGVPSAVAAAALMPALLGNVNEGDATLVAWAMASLPLAMLGQLVISINIGLGRLARYNLCRLVNAMLLFGAMAVLWRLDVLTPASVVAITVAASAAALVVGAVGFPWNALRTNMRQLWADVKFGLKVHLAGVVGLANFRLDILLMAAVLSPATVGLYSTANNVMLPVTLAAQAGSVLLTPAVAGHRATAGAGSLRDQLRLVRAEAARYTVFSVLGGVLLFVTAPFIIPFLAGPAFRDSVVLAWILIPGFIMRAYGDLLLAGTVGLRRPLLSNLSEAAALIVTISLLIVLLPRWGAVGASVTSTIAYTVAAGVAEYGVRRLERRSPSAVPDTGATGGGLEVALPVEPAAR